MISRSPDGATSGRARPSCRAKARAASSAPLHCGRAPCLCRAWHRQGALGHAIATLGDTTFDVYLNDRAFWRNVPAAIWNYKLGGYQVLKKWLSYGERDILGRALSPEEVQRFADTARKINVLLTPFGELYIFVRGDGTDTSSVLRINQEYPQVQLLAQGFAHAPLQFFEIGICFRKGQAKSD